jgi:hypothetical protein
MLLILNPLMIFLDQVSDLLLRLDPPLHVLCKNLLHPFLLEHLVLHLLHAHLLCDLPCTLHLVRVRHHTCQMLTLHSIVEVLQVLLNFLVSVTHSVIESGKVGVHTIVFVSMILEINLGLQPLPPPLFTLPLFDLFDILLILTGTYLLHDPVLLLLGLPDEAPPHLLLLMFLLEFQGCLLLELFQESLLLLLLHHYLLDFFHVLQG